MVHAFPGTQFRLDPVKAAWDIGCIVRWLDYNDTWLAAEWGHPSDNLGAILAVADFLSQQNVAAGKPPLTMHDVLTAMIKAHEIQGVLALENSFNRVGLCHVLTSSRGVDSCSDTDDGRYSRADHRCPVSGLAGWL